MSAETCQCCYKSFWPDIQGIVKVRLVWVHYLSTSMWIPLQISGIRMGHTEDVSDFQCGIAVTVKWKRQGETAQLQSNRPHKLTGEYKKWFSLVAKLRKQGLHYNCLLGGFITWVSMAEQWHTSLNVLSDSTVASAAFVDFNVNIDLCGCDQEKGGQVAVYRHLS